MENCARHTGKSTYRLRVEYNMRLRSICVNISLIIARSVADTLIAGSTVLASRVPGVDAAAPAGPAGGA